MSKKIAFVFPGQGSQSVGMLSELATQFPVVKETFEIASNTLGYDLWELTQNGPAEKLNQTVHTQPALLAAGMAVWNIWQKHRGKTPILLAGHSLGEYTALVAANALDFSAAIKLVSERGRFMQEAVPEGQGAMAAIVGLEEIKVQEICEMAAQGEVIAPANYNAIGQIVIAGTATAVARAVELAQKAGAKMAKQLPVSVPSHCALMRLAAERLEGYLSKVSCQAPQISIVNNVDVTVTNEPSAIKDALVRQLANPVRWVEIIQYFEKNGVEQIIECGPGKVLAGLNKRIVSSIPTISMNTSESLAEAINT